MSRLPDLRWSLVVLAGLAACSHNNGSGEQLLAAATIGTAGGQIEITTGLYNGLRLIVPGGALAQAVEVRMIQPAPPPLNGNPQVQAGGPGPYVRIEPQGLGFLTPAELRLPYFTNSIVSAGPGNVRALHIGPAGLLYIDPPVVDVAQGRIEFLVDSLGGFQVVSAPRPDSLADYLPTPGTTVPLENNFSFGLQSVQPVHMTGRAITQWTIDTGSFQHAVYWEAWQVAGRLGGSADWQEVWDSPLDALLPESNTLTPPAVTTTRVYSPISSPSPTFPGNVTLLGRFAFEVPLRFGDREFRDVLRIRLLTTWERPDLGTGSSELVFWFAPGVGLLQLQQDGVIRIRTDL